MCEEIKIVITKEAADVLYAQLVGRLDYFDNLIKEESKKPNPSVDKIISYANTKKEIERITEKLFKAGASIFC